MNCPNCGRTLTPNALRCRHCRRPLPGAEKEARPFSIPVPTALSVRWTFAEESFARRSAVECLVVFAVFLAGAWWIASRQFGYASTEWLRQHFFIFTREPLLQLYTRIFAETFLLKSGLVAAIFLYLVLRGDRPLEALRLSAPIQNFSRRFFIGFLLLCAGVAWWEGIDPLTPDLPTPLFFQETAVLGNLLAVLSLVVIAPVTEEIVFRGFLYPSMSALTGRAVSIFLNATMFAAVHAPQMDGAYENLAVIFIVGGLLAWQRAKTGSTWYAIGLHSLYNGALVSAGFIRFMFYGF